MNNQTSSSVIWQTAFMKVVTTTALAVTFIIPNPIVSGEKLLRSSLTENSNSSMSASTRIWQITKAERLRNIRGKYAFVKTSSEEFAQKKHNDTDIED